MKIKQEVDSAISYYEYGCRKIAEAFRNKYFDADTEIDWVGDDVTDVCCINDYYFTAEDMLLYLKHKYTVAEMVKRYDLALDFAMNGDKKEEFLNINHWVLEHRYAENNKFK